jgi:signal transduction histidine kinase
MATSVSLVVHDLKNELGALEAALEQLAADPNREAAVAAHRQCRDLRHRMVTFLTLYGADGALHAHCEDESPTGLLESLVARQDGTHPGIALVTEVAPELPAFWYFDRQLVLMALDAAVHNALGFARRQVTLRVRAEAGHLVFSVQDDGGGLGHSKPADPFATGLGTALCRTVARAHGTRRADGGVRLFNQPQGGACFELWLAA